VPDDFVDRVVPADVFADIVERTAGVEQGRRMKAAGPFEHCLHLA
jgi:hypothetical protein